MSSAIGAAALRGSANAQVVEQAATKPCDRRLPRIVAQKDGHMLCGEDGSPFFWLGDTAWQLVQQLTREECSYYLRTRAGQGFTVIQTVVLAEFYGVKEPTALGLLPFDNQDPSRPNETYFDRVVEIVEEAGREGLYVGLLPTWGDKLTAPWGAGPRLFTRNNLDVARGYARYLARKLRGHSNVIWVLGGDRPARLLNEAEAARRWGFAPDEDWTPIWRAFAEGLKDGWDAPPTIVYHPSGGQSSSRLLHGESWLSINGMQSGHGGGHDVAVWEMIAQDYAMSPAKPTLDLEPNYEDHPYNPWPEWDPATGYFRDHDVRKQLYRSVFAGGCGVTYGHHAVWQFADKRHEVINHADRDWKNALVRPAAQQVGYLRALVESRPYFRRVPDQTLIRSGAGEGGLHMQACRDRDGKYAFVYFPMMDQTASIDLSRLHAGKLRAWWYDPRNGIGTLIEKPFKAETAEFRTPPFGPDWVLVLEDADAGFTPPGLA